ncbi:hypothetical protein SAMN05421595_0243 [Austwickia chelonae]|uniref:DUF1648 domain-containing protein n=1 Tax=Austwickia chelonae NBRC 105200 TaxID=1184607 RepID=K6VLX7_9MICO|nr:hypothetical protein [Austwickia chelonae]GAB77739.1 hypothetical protein AUCHE_06_00110 [Austwickia chelonae NBRC 105200]SEV88597.1 hypothetical protein SAMN05421595_0243 [Austwickia chelonae]
MSSPVHSYTGGTNPSRNDILLHRVAPATPAVLSLLALGYGAFAWQDRLPGQLANSFDHTGQAVGFTTLPALLLTLGLMSLSSLVALAIPWQKGALNQLMIVAANFVALICCVAGLAVLRLNLDVADPATVSLPGWGPWITVLALAAMAATAVVVVWIGLSRAQRRDSAAR